MVLEIFSFLAGVAAGAITGALAGIMYGLESTANLQDRLLQVTREVEGIKTNLLSSGDPNSTNRTGIDDLHRELEEIQEEIRRMYKRTTR